MGNRLPTTVLLTLADASGAQMHRLGKKAAGRQLDGRTHDEYPA